MLKQCEGSHAVAEAVALCRPEVICAYPISPQTHIVEGIGEMVKSGELKDCEFINVESEFAAMSVAPRSLRRAERQGLQCCQPVVESRAPALWSTHEAAGLCSLHRALPRALSRLWR